MSAKILIVDDDHITGGLSRELLVDAGYTADLLTDSLAAIDQIRRERYPIVVLDILMPGIDGLTLCHNIKSDPELKATKIVMVSGKSFEADKQRAMQYGADLFIEKPYNVDTFARQIGDLAGLVPEGASAAATPAAPPPPDLKSAGDAVLQVAVWGCRSGKGPNTMRSAYGTNSPCVSVEAGGTLFIFDGGSGLQALGDSLAQSGRKEAWLFLSNFHTEHAEGLPLFAPIATPGFSLKLGAAKEPGQTLEGLLEKALAKAAAVEAQIELYDLIEEAYELVPGLKLVAFFANHPGATLGFVLEHNGRKFAYCPVSELYGEFATSMQDFDEKLGKIVAGADLLVLDGRYTSEDYMTHRNHGHSAAASAVDFAARNGVKRLLLFSSEVSYPDQTLDRIGAEAVKLAAEKEGGLQVSVARDGLKLGI